MNQHAPDTQAAAPLTPRLIFILG